MAGKTINYNLKKPAENEYYNIDDFNYNADIIDEELKKLEDGKETPSGAQAKANTALENAKIYTDEQVGLITETGIPKHVRYEFKMIGLTGQSKFDIPLGTFDVNTDTVSLFVNTTYWDETKYTKTNRVGDTWGYITLNTPLEEDKNIVIQVEKNVPIGPEGSVTGGVLADSTVDDRKLTNKTIDDTITPDSNTGSLGEVLSWFGNMIKNITGKANWRIKPTKSMEELNNDLANKVDNSRVLKDVPASAQFTDTIYVHPATAGNKHIPAGGAAGNFLKYSADGTAVWVTPTADDVGALPTTYGKIIQISSSITLNTTHANSVVCATGTSDKIITAPNTLDIGTQITVIKDGLGKVTFAPASGVTLNSTDSKRSIIKQHASVTLVKITTSVWQLFGALE